MMLSATIYRLKRNAKLLARLEKIPLYQALDRVAHQEGFQSWSHLAAQNSNENMANTLLSFLRSGDMFLVGARHGQGKTMLGLELAVRANMQGKRGFFFTLEYTEHDIFGCLEQLGLNQQSKSGSVIFDTSDDLNADHIINRLSEVNEPALVVVDYLQLLDQKRENPSLEEQIQTLRHHMKVSGNICILLSQISRSFDPQEKALPDASDIRLPNPVSLSAFDNACFLHNGRIRLDG